MTSSVAITPPRDRVPAQRCLLLAVITTVALGLAGAADARGKGKPAPVKPPVVTAAVATKTVAANVLTPASLRAANDAVTPKAIVEVPTGALRSGGTVGKAPATATADAIPGAIPLVSPQRPKDWYPESHSYLRPYHYKWRYWTPG
jgi:hypothetical protein